MTGIKKLLDNKIKVVYINGKEAGNYFYPGRGMRTAQTLINLITRVGGRNNIRNWMDQILLLELETTTEEKTTMYTINVSALHIDVQKSLASHLNGKLRKGVLTISQNPDNIAWEEVEISIYGSIDTDADRLVQLISWGEDEDSSGDPLLDEVKKNFTSLEDWGKHYCPGHKAPIINGSSLEETVASLVHYLPRKYWGQPVTMTGKTKEVAIPSLMEGDGMRNNATIHNDYDTRYEYSLPDGRIIWAGSKITHVWGEPEILGYIQKWIYEFLQREQMSWNDFTASIEHQRMLNEKYAQEKAAAETRKAAKIAAPEWFAKISKNSSLERFWVGDDYVVEYFWNSQVGTVIEAMDDRRNGLNCPNRHKSVHLGTDESTVMQRIQERLAERQAKIDSKTKIQSAYNEYVSDRQQRKLPFKSFEKWMAK